MENDRKFLLKAIDIALKGMKHGGGPFGAIVARDGEIISESHNKVVITNDPTAHAEVLAIREAASKLKTHDLSDCTLYTSCEPCPMCLGAIYWSGIKAVVYACDRNDAEKAGFNDKFIYDELVLEPGARKISFRRAENKSGNEVFDAWNTLENKIPY
jgi:tRNA(Arg) A34 adenosine deaminase TadA